MKEDLRSYFHYLELEKNVSPNTISAYNIDLKRYMSYLQSRGIDSLEQIGENEISDFLFKLREYGLSPRSVARILSSIKMFHKFLMSLLNFQKNYLVS